MQQPEPEREQRRDTTAVLLRAPSATKLITIMRHRGYATMAEAFERVCGDALAKEFREVTDELIAAGDPALSAASEE